MKKKKGIRVIVVMTLLIVLAGSSYYYSIHYNRHAVWIQPDDLEKIVEIIKETDKEIQAVQETEAYLFLTQEGKNFTEDTYGKAYPFHEGLACCVSTAGKYGYINPKGETEIPFVYDDAGYFRDRAAEVVKDGRRG